MVMQGFAMARGALPWLAAHRMLSTKMRRWVVFRCLPGGAGLTVAMVSGAGVWPPPPAPGRLTRKGWGWLGRCSR